MEKIILGASKGGAYGGAPAYGAPSYGVPSYGAPSYGAPSYGGERITLAQQMSGKAPTPTPVPPTANATETTPLIKVPAAIQPVVTALIDMNIGLVSLGAVAVIAIIIAIVIYRKYWLKSSSIEDGRVLNGIITSKSIARCASFVGESNNFSVRFWFRVNRFSTADTISLREDDLTTNIMTALGGDLTKGERAVGGVRLQLPCFDNYITESNKLFTISLVGDGKSGCELVTMYSGMNNERLVVREEIEPDGTWYFVNIQVTMENGQPILKLRVGTNPVRAKRGSYTIADAQPIQLLILGSYEPPRRCTVMDYDFIKLRMNTGEIHQSLLNLELLQPVTNLSDTLTMSTSCSAVYKAPVVRNY